MPDPTCQDFETFLGAVDPCWPKARGQLTKAIKTIYEFLNCEQGCDPGACIKDVGEGTAQDQFIAVGWGGTAPASSVCPILWAISGCDIWVKPNKASCTTWCQLCGSSSGDILTAQLRTNPGTAFSVANAMINRKIDAIEWDDSVGVSIGNSAPAGGYGGSNSFSLLTPGTYLIDVRLSTLATQSDSPTGLNIPADIYDITNAAVLKVLQNPEFATNAPGKVPFSHFGRIKVQVITPRTFSVRMNGNSGVNITSAICQGDEYLITKIA